MKNNENKGDRPRREGKDVGGGIASWIGNAGGKKS